MAFDAQSFADVGAPDHLGRVLVTYREETISIHMSWANLISMQNTWGRDWIAELLKAIDIVDLDALVTVLSMCATKEGEDRTLSREEALELGFPVDPVVRALRVAWQVAWLGGELPEEEPETEAKKMSPLTMLWRWLSRAPWLQGSHSLSSGR